MSEQQRHGLADQAGEPTVMVTTQESAEDYGKEPELDAEVLEQLEEATGDGEAVDVLAGIVGEDFHIEMMSPWGDKWLWVAIDADKAQEIYKLLGTPVTFRRTGDEDGPRQHEDNGAGNDSAET
jgi:hypothetical protein